MCSFHEVNHFFLLNNSLLKSIKTFFIRWFVLPVRIILSLLLPQPYLSFYIFSLLLKFKVLFIVFIINNRTLGMVVVRWVIPCSAQDLFLVVLRGDSGVLRWPYMVPGDKLGFIHLHASKANAFIPLLSL